MERTAIEQSFAYEDTEDIVGIAGIAGDHEDPFGEHFIEYWVWNGTRLVPALPEQAAELREREARQRLERWKRRQQPQRRSGDGQVCIRMGALLRFVGGWLGRSRPRTSAPEADAMHRLPIPAQSHTLPVGALSAEAPNPPREQRNASGKS